MFSFCLLLNGKQSLISFFLCNLVRTFEDVSCLYPKGAATHNRHHQTIWTLTFPNHHRHHNYSQFLRKVVTLFFSVVAVVVVVSCFSIRIFHYYSRSFLISFLFATLASFFCCSLLLFVSLFRFCDAFPFFYLRCLFGWLVVHRLVDDTCMRFFLMSPCVLLSWGAVWCSYCSVCVCVG